VLLNVSYVAVSGTQAAVWVAQESGLFRKYGLDTRLIYIPGAAQVIQTMLAGDIQVAAAAPSGVVDVVLAGGDLVTVGGMVNVAAFYLATRPEIKTLADLKGRPVGVTRFGASTDFTMRYVLRRAGLEPDKDVPVLQVGGQPELAAALLGGRIFAATAVPPALQRMLRGGAKILIPPKSIGLRFPHVGIVVRRNFLAARREVVKNFIQAYCEGVASLHQDKEPAKRRLARYVKSDDPEVLEATWQYAVDSLERIPRPDPEGFKVVLEERARARPELAKAKPEQFIDDSVVRELEKEGFFKKIYSH
jgi:NitT/TauT family transport system substrate-binding protein